jgi:branched-subunit amino acid ABC-type transport system permease component
VLFAIGLLLNVSMFRFVERLEPDTRTTNSLVIQNLVLLFFHADERSVTVSYAGGAVRQLEVVFPYTRSLTLLVGAVVVIALALVLNTTDFGRAIRATALDWEAAALVGPVVGAIFYIVLRERLTVSFTQFHQVIFGVLFILVVLVLPGGLVDVWGRLRRLRS